MSAVSSELGRWAGGRFHLAAGAQIADFQFVCPYGPHLVDMDDESAFAWEEQYRDPDADHFYSGHCSVCDRTVEIDYEPGEAIVHR